MGTRSITHFTKAGKPVLTIYRQSDGYPSGHGLQLAKIAASRRMVNGIPVGDEKTVANGIGCLAALIVAELKGDKAGLIYAVEPGASGMREDYTYTVNQAELGGPVTIECWSDDEQIFTGSPDEAVAKFSSSEI